MIIIRNYFHFAYTCWVGIIVSFKRLCVKVDDIIYKFYCRIGKACLKACLKETLSEVLSSQGLTSSSISPLISLLTLRIFKKSSAFGQGGWPGLVQGYAVWTPWILEDGKVDSVCSDRDLSLLSLSCSFWGDRTWGKCGCLWGPTCSL